MEKIDAEKTALLIIDMEKAFVEPGAALCISGAKATVPYCENAARVARKAGCTVYFVKRIYADDYSDMEPPRRDQLIKAGRFSVLSKNSTGLDSIEEPDGLNIEEGDKILIKPRYSAFFATNLNEELRAAGIENVLIAGTTTPNCIRSTCYDAMSYDYNTVILEKCCSSNSDEIQQGNMFDMANAGAVIFEGKNIEEIFND